MKNTCYKCQNLRVTLGWGGRVQITERGSGYISPSAKMDRIFYKGFHLTEDPNEWPVCPACNSPLEIDAPEPKAPQLEGKIDPLVWLVGFLFLVYVLGLLFF